MGYQFGKTAALGLLVVGLSQCGKTEKVEGIKGPQGDKGQQGDRGETGPQGPQGQQGLPWPTPTITPTNGQGGNGSGNGSTQLPPIIIINPGQDCNKLNCPAGTIMVCACIDGKYQTISLEQRDLYKVRIRNYGRCEDFGRQLNPNDCIFWPRRDTPRPTVTVTVQPMPIPVPTVTITAYPIPYPTVTVYPQPRPNEC